MLTQDYFLDKPCLRMYSGIAVEERLTEMTLPIMDSAAIDRHDSRQTAPIPYTLERETDALIDRAIEAGTSRPIVVDYAYYRRGGATAALAWFMATYRFQEVA